MKKITFDHAVYQKRGHVSGAYPPDQPGFYEPVRGLVKHAEAALYSRPGHFIDTLDTDPRLFVFGFLSVEQENREEPFFDLYLTPVSEVDSVSLIDLRDSLWENSEHITNRHDPISDTVTVEVARAVRYESQDQTGSTPREHNVDPSESLEPEAPDNSVSPDDSDENDDIDPDMPVREAASGVHEAEDNKSTKGSHQHEDPHETVESDSLEEIDETDGHGEIYATLMTFEEVADLWERRRQGDGPAATTLTELNRFVATVDGAESEIEFVSNSPDGGDPSHFAFAGLKNRQQADATDLADRLARDYEIATLHWDDLPTYEDELRELRSSLSEELSELGEYDELATRNAAIVHAMIQDELASYHRKQAADVFESAVAGDIQKEKEQGRLDEIRSIVRSNPDHDRYETIAASLETESLDHKEKTAIAEQLGTAVRSEFDEHIQTRLEEFEQQLQEQLDEQIEIVLRRTIEQIDDLRSSEAYREVSNN